MMGHELIVLGLAFLLAGLLARAGRRVGLPTIPLFMAAGILVGPNTPGAVLFEHPEDLGLLAAFGLIFLLVYLGVEFSFEDLTSGGGRLLASADLYLGLNLSAALAADAGLDARLTPFIAVYVLTLAVVSPILATHSTWVARLIPSRMVPTPRPSLSREPTPTGSR